MRTLGRRIVIIYHVLIILFCNNLNDFSKVKRNFKKIAQSNLISQPTLSNIKRAKNTPKQQWYQVGSFAQYQLENNDSKETQTIQF